MENLASIPDNTFLTGSEFITEKNEIIQFHEGDIIGTDENVLYRQIHKCDKNWYFVVPGLEPAQICLKRYCGEVWVFQNLKTSFLYRI
jgi:hypothetical protein